MYVCIYMYVCMYVCVYIYIYIYFFFFRLRVTVLLGNLLKLWLSGEKKNTLKILHGGLWFQNDNEVWDSRLRTSGLEQI